MRVELAGIAGRGFTRRVARHLDVAAEGKDGQAVVGVTTTEAEEALAEPDGEDLDTDSAEFGDGEVAELMDKNHDAEHDGKFEDGGHRGDSGDLPGERVSSVRLRR